MKGRLSIALFAVASGLVGCDGAPSTPLAPDKPAADASKMSPEDVEKMLKQNRASSEHER